MYFRTQGPAVNMLELDRGRSKDATIYVPIGQV